MRFRLVSLVLCGSVTMLALSGCGGARKPSVAPAHTAADRSPARLITASAHSTYQVGRYRLSRVMEFKPGTPSSLADAERALGRADSCTAKYADAQVRWSRLGLQGDFTTLGAFADAAGQPITDGSATGCRYRAQVQINQLTATGAHWHTAQGLVIGDPLKRLLDLYPRAVRDGDRWWLHTARLPWSKDQDSPDVTARVVGGRVRAITLLIGAQGD